jgi:hypothetical protein
MKTDPEAKAAARCKKKFLYYFKKGFADQKYLDWERDYKWNAHLAFSEKLNKAAFKRMIGNEQFAEIAKLAVNIESRTNLLFSFEKMALRDGVKSPKGAEIFARGLFNLAYGNAPLKTRFESFTESLSMLPRKQTRVLTWPLQTVFGFIARPDEQIFLKPRVTQVAARAYAFDFKYRSRPNWETYQSLLEFAAKVKKDTSALQPRDYIDLQSFIWVMGSDEYP